MGQRIVTTPNGKYAAFSDIVDHFTAYDMTREEAVQYCSDKWDMGPIESENKVLRAEEDKTADGGTGRYEESMKTIHIVHGKEEEDRYRELLTR